MSIQQNLILLQNRIHEYELRYHRQPGSVQLLAVSKKQPVENIQEAIHAGQTRFGENYLQEALTKITQINHPQLEWHFIGPIQSNKTRKIAENFAWVHSVDSIKLAKRLSEQRPEYLPPLNICLEVNISQEASKSGVLPEDAQSLAEYCVNSPRIRLRGLMTIPAPKHTLTEQRKELSKLKTIYDALIKNGFALDTLSMGMSDDLEAAIAEGATMVRIGTAIFGKRK